MSDPPFYQRTLDSFTDDIITRVRASDDARLWYAVLDVGIARQVADPDFSTAAKTREDAVAQCAERIRQNAMGIGQQAPRQILVPGYDLHFRLMQHWVRKERIQALGGDPNAVVLGACASLDVDEWKLDGDWRTWVDESKSLEFDYQVALLELGAALKSGAEPAEAMEAMHQGVIDGYMKSIHRRTSPTDPTWDLMRARTVEFVREIGFDPNAPTAGMRM